ncbi:OprO/OprP family phosphate-selective porin [Hydrocarboniphaga sp.]|uniref:OprO/OprP family phosphate-selective porin n=1 Tax=Hydrocarboniphaga sp. TaxID=2033016 RepID=UPI003D11E204
MKSNATTTSLSLPAFVLTATAAAVLASFSGAARADDAPTTADLDQRIKVLERQLEIQQEDAAAKAKDATTASAGEKGFSLKKGDYEIKFSALAQVDGRFYLDDGPTDTQPAAPRFNDGFRLRRLRPTIQGTLGKLVGFRFTPEFAGDGSGLAASIVDAYIDLKFDPAASLRVGKQKGPVGLERLQSGGAIDFVERGYPTELVPNRDIGVNLFGELLSSTVNYSVGIFNGTRDGRDIDAADSDNRHEIEGRLFTEPFKNAPGVFQGLGFGVGGSTGTRNTRNGTTITNPAQYRTPGQNTFFSYASTVFADGTQTRLTPQAYWYYNNVGLLAEYVSSKQELTNSVTTGTGSAAVTTVTEGKFTNKAYEVTATYVLTGEDTSYKGVVKPKNSYTIGGPGWGAFELAARYGELDVDNDAFTSGFASATASASKASSYGVGVNWYLSANAKVVLDYDHTKFDGGAVAGQDRLAEKTIFTRLQITY